MDIEDVDLADNGFLEALQSPVSDPARKVGSNPKQQAKPFTPSSDKWRQGEPTAKQIALLHQLGYKNLVESKGEASDLIASLLKARR